MEVPSTVETFKRCPDIPYEISDQGNVRRVRADGTTKPLTCSIRSTGYKYFQLTRDYKRINYPIHQLVAKLFIGERPPGLVVDHIDRDKLNNCASNLRYITHKENLQNCDRYRDDIEEKDPKKRSNIISKLNKQKIKREKRYYCGTCDIAFSSPGKLASHMACDRHARKVEYSNYQKQHEKTFCKKCYQKWVRTKNQK